MRRGTTLLVVAVIVIASLAMIVYGNFTDKARANSRESLAEATSAIHDIAANWAGTALIDRMTPTIAATLDPAQIERSFQQLRPLGPVTAMGACKGSVSATLSAGAAIGTPPAAPPAPAHFVYQCEVTYRASPATVDIAGDKLGDAWKLTYFKVTPRPAPPPA